MKHSIILAGLISISCAIHAMDCAIQPKSTWIKTNDNQIMEIDEAIVQQSNVLMVMRELYAKTKQNPVPIPVDKESFKFFCNALTNDAQTIKKQLPHEWYCALMDIAEKLKCPIFYAELMQQLLPKDVDNKCALKHVNTSKLTKAVYKHCLKKERLKKTKRHSKEDFHIEYSNDGNYFIENISNDGSDEVHLWDAKKLSIIKTFPDYSSAIFSPTNDYIIVYMLKGLATLYFIKQENEIHLQDANESLQSYTPTISPNGRYVMQKFQIHYNDYNHTLHYLIDDGSFKKISLQNNWNFVLTHLFHPNNQHIICITEENTLIAFDIYNNTSIIISSACANGRQQLKFNQNGSLLSLNSSDLEIKLFNIQDFNNIKIIQNITHTDSYHQHQPLFIPGKKIIVCKETPSTFLFLDENAKQIGSYTTENDISSFFVDTNGNHLASVHNDKTVLLWDLSSTAPYIPKTKIDFQKDIYSLAFTKDGLLIIQSDTTELWNMNGDQVLNLDQSQKNALNPRTGSVLSCKKLNNHIFLHTHSHRRLLGPTKLWLSNINQTTVDAVLSKIRKELTLPQALLFNKLHAQKKLPNRTKLHANMPDGRILASFKKEYKFLKHNFKLSKTPSVPNL